MGGVFVEDAIAGESPVDEGCCRVLFIQDLYEWVDVETAESAVLGKGGWIVSDVELVLDEPDIRFDTRAAEMNGLV